MKPIVGAGSVKKQLILFKTDHERHIYQLSAVIQALDSEHPSLAPDFKGRLVQGLGPNTLVRVPATSPHTIKINEERVNHLYRECCVQDFTPGIKEW